MKPQPEATHTPLPWKVREYKYGKDYTGIIETMDGIYLGEMSCTMGKTKKEDQTPIANAAFICRATNHYELMVDLLRRINSENGGASGKLKEEIEKAFNSMGEVL